MGFGLLCQMLMSYSDMPPYIPSETSFCADGSITVLGKLVEVIFSIIVESCIVCG